MAGRYKVLLMLKNQSDNYSMISLILINNPYADASLDSILVIMLMQEILNRLWRHLWSFPLTFVIFDLSKVKPKL